jgi:hypothetical protein
MRNDGAPHVRILSETTPVARLGHACGDCPDGCSISPGERYHKAVMLVDGHFVIDRHCIGPGCGSAAIDAEMARYVAERDQPLGPDELAF